MKPADHEQKKKRKYKQTLAAEKTWPMTLKRCVYLRPGKEATGSGSQETEIRDRLCPRSDCLRMRRLQRLPGKSAVHPSKEDGQKIAGRPRQAFECLQIFYPTAKSNGEKDFHSRRDPAPGQSFHSGGGRVCRNQGRSELPPISDPRKRQCHSGMVSCEHGV